MNSLDGWARKPVMMLVAWVVLGGTRASADEAGERAEQLVGAVGVHGGLCVQIGGKEVSLATVLADTGRFLVHVLDEDAQTVRKARRPLSDQGAYGLISVDRWDGHGRLPYTENVVNLLVILDVPRSGFAPGELNRVLCPNGVVLSASRRLRSGELTAAGLTDIHHVRSGRKWLMARKPWPAAMDEWTHPRHSAAGNAVSADTLVGPLRRVRWVVGAQAEVRGMVSAGGRNFYAGVLARDAFNGLRLWQHDLLNPAAQGPLVMKNLPSEVLSPVAAGDHLFAVSDGKLLALNAATGKIVREYPDAGRPQGLLHVGGVLIAVDRETVRSLDASTGRLRWSFSAAEPRNVVAGDDYVALIQGRTKRGEKSELVVLDRATGQVGWKRDDLPWAAKVQRCVYSNGLLAYEVSTFNDNGPGNAIHMVAAADGRLCWDRGFLPGMNHTRQARAMFIGDRLWILQGGKDAEKRQYPIQCAALNPQTGEVLTTYDAGLTHCFPPVATPRYLLAGELDLTDLATGQVDANRITKAACSRDSGWIPANGLVYVTPKHCVCWPMLRGYAALAPERSEGSVAQMKVEDIAFVLEKGVDPPVEAPATAASDWPCYRHDAWRSGSTTTAGPERLDTLWSVDLGGPPADGPIVADWRENPFVKGPVTAPVVAGGLVYVARPDAHEVVALDAVSGNVRWRFTAGGRVDTAPTIERGLCLFGDKSGWVYALRADNGQVVWKLRAAPLDERIVAYGQLESPWPVPGSVLVVDGTAYFAAGRQSLADGGIFIFAVDPASGATHWVKRLDSVPQQGFYECSGLEFDNFDLLHRQGSGVAMSRWVFDRATGEMSLDRWDAFARLNTGGGSAMVPQGCWSYAPRHQRRIASHTHRRPLVVFRDNVLLGCQQGSRALYRRDFDLEGGEEFDARWITGWAASQASREGKMPWRSTRLAEKATWKVDVYDAKKDAQTIDAMVLAGARLFTASSGGELRVLSTTDGKLLAQRDVPRPLWDGMAVAGGRLYLTTAAGELMCLGG